MQRGVIFIMPLCFVLRFTYICIDLACPEGRALVKNIDGLCPKGHERTFSKRYLQVIKLRKLDQPEDIATKRLRWVYYIRMSSAVRLMYISYNTQWRGLAKLLILIEGQCEGLMTKIGGGSFSHVFFVPHLILL